LGRERRVTGVGRHRWTGARIWLRRTCLTLLAAALASLGLLAAVAAGLPPGRVRERAADLLPVRGRWLALVPIGFDPMPAWPPLTTTVARRAPAQGPLSVHPGNARYFADDRGRVVYLTGSHTWTTLQDAGDGNPPAAFDYDAFLDRLESHHHNFFRLWRWEQARWGSWNNIPGFRIAPHPYPRTGPGEALDGLPRFDLDRFDQAYFDRLRARVQEAGRRGFYVAVMLFNGWSIEDKGIGWGNNPWRGHPFHAENNVNGVDGDPDGDGQGLETHSLDLPAALALQERYVRKVVDTVNDLDNVLYEISNEGGPRSIGWQYHMIRLVKDYEATLLRQHPVGMTGLYPWPGGRLESANAALDASPADWISPAGDPHERPVASGAKVVVADTDHLCGICGDSRWVWTSFTRGENPLFMDVWNCAPWWYPSDCHRPQWSGVRQSLGYTRVFTERLDLAAMLPRPDRSSTGHLLADTTGHAYLVYAPDGGHFSVDLTAGAGPFDVEWFDPAQGRAQKAVRVTGGATRTFTAPFEGHAVLYLTQIPAGAK
jgi:hypothetical protein